MKPNLHAFGMKICKSCLFILWFCGRKTGSLLVNNFRYFIEKVRRPTSSIPKVFPFPVLDRKTPVNFDNIMRFGLMYVKFRNVVNILIQGGGAGQTGFLVRDQFCELCLRMNWNCGLIEILRSLLLHIVCTIL